MNVLIINDTINLSDHFVNENVFIKKVPNVKYDVEIICKKTHVTIGNKTIKIDKNLKSKLNELLAKKIIKKRSEKLRQKISHLSSNSLDDSFKKLQIIKDTYRNYKAIIVTCGPSFNDYKQKVYKLIDSRTILVCVKQSFKPLGCADFHIQGSPEVAKTYKYLRNKPITLAVQGKQRHFKGNDISFANYGPKKRRQTLYDIPKGIDSMSWENIDKHLMIHLAHAMHGVALPLCVHLGISNIFVIGWDGLVPGVKQSHFYNGGKRDVSHYGSTAIVECNKYTTKFLKDKFGVNLYQINTKSLYNKIPKKTIDECINF